MNREIKFRVWDGHKLHINVSAMIFSHKTIDCGTVLVQGIPLIVRDNCVWTQFTGLLDKNGKEIYEGDIVKWDTYWFDIDGPDGMGRKPITKYGNVVYFSRGFWIQSEKHPEGFGWEGEDLWNWNEIEVIGNKFEAKLLPQT